MSGEPKTLWEMTPREAWEHAWEQAIDTCRVFEEEATAGRLEVVRSIGRQYLDQDAGVPVVARDEASEATPQGPNPLLLLADAIEETVGQAMWGQTLSGRADLDGRDKVMALLEQVRRLAGGENEK